ncbi:Rho GTPase-activating protein 29 [Homalodisca vitripennis]|nr:Rho GTPase-activating protein 29 [Homalodisca vitripennis]
MGDTTTELQQPSDNFSSKSEGIAVNGFKAKHSDTKSEAPVTPTTFGVDLDEHLCKMGTKVPTIVSKCIKAIEDHGILVKGIYRVSGVKSRVERLCQEFEVSGGEDTDLSDTHPNVIANVLKLYLRQLPQPLFTFQLYPEFIRYKTIKVFHVVMCLH